MDTLRVLNTCLILADYIAMAFIYILQEYLIALIIHHFTFNSSAGFN